MTNGITPLKMVDNFTSGKRDLTVNTFMPTGGVSIPISIIMTTKIPNQIGDAPNSTAITVKIGAVSSSNPMASIRAPKTR